MFASEDKSGAALFALGLDKDILVEETLCLRGLDPDAKYVVTEINRDAKLHAELPKAPVSGRTLMEKGIAVRLSGKFDSASFEVTLAR
ncbi:MAG: GH36 C-terminal domain-containing protein [Kiritimatiellae bacterium]|nr:GH36 C-terminal domain-containing protein [Kiritimatiellia bacterium]